MKQVEEREKILQAIEAAPALIHEGEVPNVSNLGSSLTRFVGDRPPSVEMTGPDKTLLSFDQLLAIVAATSPRSNERDKKYTNDEDAVILRMLMDSGYFEEIKGKQ